MQMSFSKPHCTYTTQTVTNSMLQFQTWHKYIHTTSSFCSLIILLKLVDSFLLIFWIIPALLSYPYELRLTSDSGFVFSCVWMQMQYLTVLTSRWLPGAIPQARWTFTAWSSLSTWTYSRVGWRRLRTRNFCAAHSFDIVHTVWTKLLDHLFLDYTYLDLDMYLFLDLYSSYLMRMYFGHYMLCVDVVPRCMFLSIFSLLYSLCNDVYFSYCCSLWMVYLQFILDIVMLFLSS